VRAFIVSCVFPPEPVVSASTSGQIAEELFKRGHDVTVICPVPSRPEGRWYAGISRKLWTRSATESGVPVLRLLAIPSVNSSFSSRSLENLSFGIGSAIALAVMRKPDVIYANTWPIIAGALLMAVARVRRIPVVLSVQDLYPESLASQGRVASNAWLSRMVQRIDRWIAHSARALVVISERFAETYRSVRGVQKDRIHVIPNWGRDPGIGVSEAGDDIRLRMGITPDAFLLVYGGNVGVAAGVETVVEAMRHVKNERVVLLVAGAGDRLQSCRALAAGMQRDSVRLLSPWPTDQTLPVLTAADVLVLPTLADQSLSSVPSKLISYSLAARPVLALALPKCDLAAAIDEAGGGWVIAPDDPRALAAMIDQISTLGRNELRRIGAAARDYALSHYTDTVCVPQLAEIIERAADNGSR
jgi:colanic acid biosynthesis glycosyl transferase WcaI